VYKTQRASTHQLSLWRLILSDLSRYKVTDRRSYLVMLIICPGSIAGVVFRIGHWIWTYHGRFAVPVFLLRTPYILLKRLSEVITGIALQPQATIGKGLYIGHGGSVFVGGSAVLGENCNLSHEVTIGVGGRGDERGMPVIGDRVYVAAGAKIFGKLTVGNDVAVGANAVVTKSVPDCAVAVGIPARVISYEGSFDFIQYKGMETDPKRVESLQSREQAQNQSNEVETPASH
jgi:serine O-acetyltransferase